MELRTACTACHWVRVRVTSSSRDEPLSEAEGEVAKMGDDRGEAGGVESSPAKVRVVAVSGFELLDRAAWAMKGGVQGGDGSGLWDGEVRVRVGRVRGDLAMRLLDSRRMLDSNALRCRALSPRLLCPNIV